MVCWATVPTPRCQHSKSSGICAWGKGYIWSRQSETDVVTYHMVGFCVNHAVDIVSFFIDNWHYRWWNWALRISWTGLVLESQNQCGHTGSLQILTDLNTYPSGTLPEPTPRAPTSHWVNTSSQITTMTDEKPPRLICSDGRTDRLWTYAHPK